MSGSETEIEETTEEWTRTISVMKRKKKVCFPWTQFMDYFDLFIECSSKFLILSYFGMEIIATKGTNHSKFRRITYIKRTVEPPCFIQFLNLVI